MERELRLAERGLGAPDEGGMARTVVRNLRNPTPRCARCQHVPRWCICDGLRTVECPVAVDVLMHRREAMRPSSTGHLIKRVLPASRLHLYDPHTPLERAQIARPGKALWVLHPLGEAMPAGAMPAEVQIRIRHMSEAGNSFRLLFGVHHLLSMPSIKEGISFAA